MQHASAKSNAVQTVFATLITMLSMVTFADVALAQDAAGGVVGNMAGLGAGLPALISNTSADGSTSYSLSLQILALMTAMTVLPSLVLGMTSFTRIIIVLSILRQAMGHSTNPSQSSTDCDCLILNLFHHVTDIDNDL